MICCGITTTTIIILLIRTASRWGIPQAAQLLLQARDSLIQVHTKLLQLPLQSEPETSTGERVDGCTLAISMGGSLACPLAWPAVVAAGLGG